MSITSNYDTWSREELIQRIHELEDSKLTHKNKKVRKTLSTSFSSSSLQPPYFATENSMSSSSTESPEKIARNLRKQQKLETMPTHRVALKLAYLGWHHEGFASQAHTENTVESHLFNALTKSFLCKNIKEAEYDRCGRTDKGVSALGNVVSLNLRSKSNSKTVEEEYPYALILNRLLPPSIRILAWAYVPTDFSSRYSCQSRTYTYLLPALGLNKDAVQRALISLEGEHDFRHFCKLDPNKPDRTYLRTIYKTVIQPFRIWNQPYFMIQLVGSAFLWHQIRYIMHLLTLIGMELESPDLIATLFNVHLIKAKPAYPMASELPLILTECTFDQIAWNCIDPPKQSWQNIQNVQTQAWILQFLLQKQCLPASSPSSYSTEGISLDPEVFASCMHQWAGISVSKYTPILKRVVCESVEARTIKLKEKNERKAKYLKDENNKTHLVALELG